MFNSFVRSLTRALRTLLEVTSLNMLLRHDAFFTFGENAGDSALVLGLSATGLQRLEGADEDLATFPVAFQHGMAAPARGRLLNDTGPDDAAHWAWGGERDAADVFGSIEVGQRYDFTTVWPRVPVLSMFPVIASAG